MLWERLQRQEALRESNRPMIHFLYNILGFCKSQASWEIWSYTTWRVVLKKIFSRFPNTEDMVLGV